MARGPFSLFRKHQKLLLVVFGVLIIFVFTLGSAPIAMNFLGVGAPQQAEDPAVMRWKGGVLRERDLAMMRYRHRFVIQFLQVALQTAIQEGARPSAPGITVNPRTGMIMDPGLPRNDTNQSLARTMLLAKKAQQLGFEMTDESIYGFLDNLTDNTLTNSQFQDILVSALRGQISDYQLFEWLRIELLSQQLLIMATSSFGSTTPGENWDYFNRLRHMIAAEIMPLAVDDYVDQVDEPTAAEVSAFFEKYRDDFPETDSPDPGFKRRRRISIEYLQADYEQFLQREMENVTDEQVQEYYVENKDQEFTLPELTDDPEADPRTATPKPPVPPSTLESSGGAPGNDEQQESDPSNSEPEATGGLDPRAAVPNPPIPPDNTESNDNQPQPPAPLALAQAEDDPGDAGSSTPAEAVVESADEPSSESVSVEVDLSADASLPLEEDQPAETEGGPATRYRPLEEVADLIRRRIAMPIASETITENLAIARNRMQKYFTAHRMWLAVSDSDKSAQSPPKLDLQQLADELDMTAGSTELLDELEMSRQYDVGQSEYLDSNGYMPFSSLAYDRNVLEFSPRETFHFTSQNRYVFWKIASDEAHVPELDDVREKVVQAWKRRKAVDLAIADGESIVKLLGESGESLLDSQSVFQDKEVIVTDEFTWLAGGDIPNSPLVVGEVDGVEQASDEFMRKVFALPVGQTGVAVNRPRTVVYVVHVARETLDENLRREEFLKGGSTENIQRVALREQRRLILEWIDELEKEMEVHWEGKPQGPGSYLE